MIATRARALAELVERTYQSEQRLEENDAYQSTTDSLLALGCQIRSLVDDYRRVAKHVGPSQRIELQRALEYSGDELNRIRLQLRSNPRQSNEIGKLTKQITAAASRLEASWRTWSNQQIQPHRDALELVNFLPEIQEQHTAIDLALVRATELSSSLPKTDESLQTFLTTLRTLEAVLGDVEGISATIRDFLARVVSNQATLQDLNPEVLEWMQERGRAKVFRIGFKATQGRF